MTTETTTLQQVEEQLKQHLTLFQEEDKSFYYESNLVKDDQGNHIKVLADFSTEPTPDEAATRIYLIAPIKHQPTEDTEIIATTDLMHEMVEAVNNAAENGLEDATRTPEQDWHVTDSREYSEHGNARIIKGRKIVYNRENL